MNQPTIESIVSQAVNQPLEEKIERLTRIKGQFTSVYWESVKKPAAAFKMHSLTSRSQAVVRAGIDYANLGTVKAGIESGERGEVEPLPWGEWAIFPYVITHKGETYFRLYPTANVKTDYFIDGQQVESEAFFSMMPPSARSGEKPACITVKASNCEIKG